jgi:hypothetical protein
LVLNRTAGLISQVSLIRGCLFFWEDLLKKLRKERNQQNAPRKNLMKNQIQTVKKNSPALKKEWSLSAIGKLQLGLVVDKSGSMNPLRSAVVSSVNRLLSQQKELFPHRAIVSLRTFNSKVQEVFTDVPLYAVQPISYLNYDPEGGTALLDGIGTTIAAVWHLVGAAPNTPVVIVICSDGEENSSKEFTMAEVRNQIVSKRFCNGWQFLFLSCDERASNFALDLGIPKESIIDFDADPKGITSILDRLSKGLTAYRLGSKNALLRLKDKEVGR